MSAYKKARVLRLGIDMALFGALLGGCAGTPAPVADTQSAKPALGSDVAGWRLFDAALGTRKQQLGRQLVRQQTQWSTCEIREAAPSPDQAPNLESCVVSGLGERPDWLASGASISRIRYVFANDRLRQIEVSFAAPSHDAAHQDMATRLGDLFGPPDSRSPTELVWLKDGQRAVLRRDALVLENAPGAI